MDSPRFALGNGFFAFALAAALVLSRLHGASAGERDGAHHRARVIDRDRAGEAPTLDNARYVRRTHARNRRGWPAGSTKVIPRGWNADPNREAGEDPDFHPFIARVECPRPPEPKVRAGMRAPVVRETWFGDQPGLNSLPAPTPADAWRPTRTDRLVGPERTERFAEYYPSREIDETGRALPPDRWEARRDLRGEWRGRVAERRDKFDLGIEASRRGIEFRRRDVPRGDGILR